jgi:hypothetical protein
MDTTQQVSKMAVEPLSINLDELSFDDLDKLDDSVLSDALRRLHREASAVVVEGSAHTNSTHTNTWANNPW